MRNPLDEELYPKNIHSCARGAYFFLDGLISSTKVLHPKILRWSTVGFVPMNFSYGVSPWFAWVDVQLTRYVVCCGDRFCP